GSGGLYLPRCAVVEREDREAGRGEAVARGQQAGDGENPRARACRWRSYDESDALGRPSAGHHIHVRKSFEVRNHLREVLVAVDVSLVTDEGLGRERADVLPEDVHALGSRGEIEGKLSFIPRPGEREQ